MECCLGRDEPMGARILALEEARDVAVHPQVPMSCLMHHSGMAAHQHVQNNSQAVSQACSPLCPYPIACTNSEQTHDFPHLIRKG